MPQTHQTLRHLAASAAGLILSLLTLSSSYAQPVNDADWHWSGEAEQQVQAERIRQQARSSLPNWSTGTTSATATVALQTMFSAQAGSWPFEPFVNNGLFRAIAGYQSSHPQAVVIGKGQITLEQLHQRLADPRILKRYKDGYLLSYPLMVEADGALLVKDSHLYLLTPSGTALINLGTLSLVNATLESWNDDSPTVTDRPFRPFIMAWAGSTTEIRGSTLRKLGYNAHLSRGMSSARSSGQPLQQEPARVLISDSRIDALSSVELQAVQARIEHSTFTNLQQYAIDLQDARLHLSHNRIQQVRNQSGIRIRGSSVGVVEHNTLLQTEKAGIEINDQSGNLVLADNQIGASRGNGILLRNVASDTADSALLVSGNLIGNSDASGVYADNLQRAYIVGNQIHASANYGISVLNPGEQPSELVVIGNTLGNIGQVLIRTEGVQQLTLGNNDYQLGPLTQSILGGDILALQSLLLDATYKRGCIIQVRPATARQASFPAKKDCQVKKAASGSANQSAHSLRPGKPTASPEQGL
jgi:poly(beta-D-mannuronate) C5 epimerase